MKVRTNFVSNSSSSSYLLSLPSTLGSTREEIATNIAGNTDGDLRDLIQDLLDSVLNSDVICSKEDLQVFVEEEWDDEFHEDEKARELKILNRGRNIIYAKVGYGAEDLVELLTGRFGIEVHNDQ